jgi:hypothetical protein
MGKSVEVTAFFFHYTQKLREKHRSSVGQASLPPHTQT